MSSRSKIGNAIGIFACVCLVVFSTCSFAKASAEPEVFKYKDGFISLKGDGVSFLPLLQRISESTGIQIVIVSHLNPSSISVDMTDKPIEEALKSILKGYSYAAIYSDGSAGGVNIITAGGGYEINPRATSQKDRICRQRIEPSLISASSTGQASPFAHDGRKSAGDVDRRTLGYQTSAAHDHDVIARSKTNGEQAGATEQQTEAAQQQTQATEQAEATEQQAEVAEQADVIAQAASATREGRLRYWIENLEHRIESGQSDRDYELWSGIMADICRTRPGSP
ncbi:MAG: hypothetical protein BA867_04465 [Desulfobacterales bacterium S5133MH16]|nr:MAG: hypothetical protein BA867_04465 [Desulfobacterales bacterium S5133MH16]